jgi:hypothetical protein
MRNRDIGPILDEWPYDPGHITVRKIIGDDGAVKIQMRLDLGMLQLEMDGRPDGKRPYGAESLLDYHLERLRTFRKANGTDEGFKLSPDKCRELRSEAAMYYHRYLSLFVLEEYDRVERDTERNLQVLDLCYRYGSSERDRMVLQQFRPYIVMINTRARVLKGIKRKQWRRAMADVEEGIRKIRDFLEEWQPDDEPQDCPELKLLRRLRRKIRRQLPVDPLEQLSQDLREAVRDERYEEAARLRDQITALSADRRPHSPVDR